jgi:Sigma-70 region 2
LHGWQLDYSSLWDASRFRIIQRIRGICVLLILSLNDERELATEVLCYRHLFTEQLLGSPKFRRAALTVIQNIYLFNNRKIFFGTTTASTENERQEALLLFSGAPCRTSLPLAKTFQHLIIARVWNRIISQSSTEVNDQHFIALHDVVERLNTLRNIYMLLTAGLVRKLAATTNTLYKESVTYEDAVQIGWVGIARAAYRYHQSCGVRFSTFAANWVYREIQRQALSGRLIRN